MKIEVEMKDVVEGGSVIVVNVVAVVVVAVVVVMVELEGVLNVMKRAILLMHVLIQAIKIIINKNALNVVKLGINHLKCGKSGGDFGERREGRRGAGNQAECSQYLTNFQYQVTYRSLKKLCMDCHLVKIEFLKIQLVFSPV